MDGALMEIGPYRVREGGKLEYNNGSWDEFANLLFVDQPVGTGFSYVNTDSYLSELDQMAEQFMVFLEQWFALFPEYEHDDVGSPRLLSPRQRLTVHSYISPESHTPGSISHT
jgi:carboxypeptidase D